MSRDHVGADGAARLWLSNEGRDAVEWSDGRPPVVGPAGACRLSAGGPAADEVDAWGIPAGGLHRVPPLVTDLAFAVTLESPGCPFGPLRTTILVGGDGSVRSESWGPLAQAIPSDTGVTNLGPMALEGPYALLLGWLHREVIFGNLVWAGAAVTGDLLDFVAVDGIVSAPVVPGPEAEVVDALFALLPGALGDGA